MLRSIAHQLAGDEMPLPVEGNLPSFDGASGWLNTEPLTPEALRGRVVFVQVWTYTCINWLRTLPYVRTWATKYADQGLTVIGVHTPEFGFEHDAANVITAAREMGVTWPIALDNDYGVWTAFANHFWPAVYVADALGRIRYHHFGEAEYAMQEMVIQQLLVEAGAHGVKRGVTTVEPHGVELPADWESLRTPETYLSYGRSSAYASPEAARFEAAHTYPSPGPLELNTWAPSGTWTIGGNAAVLNEPNGRIAFCFQARDVHLVMSPGAGATPVPFRVFLDGQAPDAAHGLDVDDQGRGTLVEPRMYQLIRQPGRIGERTFEIEFLAAGVEAYSFTFG